MDRLTILILKRLIRQLKANLAAATSLSDFKTSMGADLAVMQQDYLDLQAALNDINNPQALRDAILAIARK